MNNPMDRTDEDRAGDQWVRHVLLFIAASTALTLVALLVDRPASIALVWLGGLLFGLISEFRRPTSG